MAELPDVDARIKQEESKFRELFQVILEEIMNMKNVRESYVADAISSMIEGFKRYEFPDMEQWKNVCAYLFRYAPHGAGLTRDRMLKAVEECERVDLASFFRKTDLRIVSLGGGPGNDIIGFCSALFECVEECQSSDIRCNLNITVIDHYIEWSECAALLRNLVKKENFGNVSELFRLNDVRMSFLQGDISAGLTGDYFNSVREADVILMVKLISGEFWNNLGSDGVTRFVLTLKETMKDEALLLYIDSPILRMVTSHFYVLFQSNLENYCMSCEIYERFNSNDNVESKAQIAVLCKSGSSLE